MVSCKNQELVKYNGIRLFQLLLQAVEKCQKALPGNEADAIRVQGPQLEEIRRCLAVSRYEKEPAVRFADLFRPPCNVVFELCSIQRVWESFGFNKQEFITGDLNSRIGTTILKRPLSVELVLV